MALMFFPRGGSSQVVRYLARSLPASGWEVTLACGSLGGRGSPPTPRPSSPAWTLGPSTTPRQQGARSARRRSTLSSLVRGSGRRAGSRVRGARRGRLRAPGGYLAAPLAAAGAAEFDLLHLHHLTPINEAAERDFPEVPRIGHLHGTELLMLREIEQGSPPAGSTPALGRSACAPGRAAARGCSFTGRGAAGAAPARRRARAGGLGAERVRPRRVCQAPARAGGTHRALAALAGRGAARWDESGRPGSIAYRERDLEAFKAGGPVLLYVGRFTAVKRIAPHSRARARVRALRAPRAARTAGRLPRRVGGRAPAGRGAPDRRPRCLPRRLAWPRRPPWA